MLRRGSTALGLTLALLVAIFSGFSAAGDSATASPLLRVSDDRVVRVNDVHLPPISKADPLPRRSANARAQGAPATARLAGGGSVSKVLQKALASNALSQSSYDDYSAAYADAKTTLAALKGRNKTELGAVVATLDQIARAGQLAVDRMRILFMTLKNNTSWWKSRSAPASGARLTFEPSTLIFQYYVGQGLQFQPLGTFGKANGLWSSKTFKNREVMQQMLADLMEVSVKRGGFTTWEYYFKFAGGRPPWVSAMTQGTALQAMGRAGSTFEGRRLGGVSRGSRYFDTGRKMLGLFKTLPPVGAYAKAKGAGAWYLLYSFAPKYWVLNGFLQALIGLWDYSYFTGDEEARVLFEKGNKVALAYLPKFDTGKWSLYALNGERASASYHELQTGFLEGLCERTTIPEYCKYASLFAEYSAK